MAVKTINLIKPYGGLLVNLMVNEDEKPALKELAAKLNSVILTDRTVCDLEMLATGAFSPLQGFMDEEDYHSVLKNMRLKDGTLFPVPITLPVHEQFTIGEKVALRDGYGNLLAIMTINDIYQWDREEYAKNLIGANDTAHMLVEEMQEWGVYNIAGELQVLALPAHKDFVDLRLTPQQARQKLSELGNENVVAFQTRNPLHRAHEELTKRAAEKIDGTLLLHPVVGMTKPGDVDHITRVRCYKALIRDHYSDYNAMLSLVPLAMRMAGPREALWHAIIRRNYGASHFIVGRDHAGPGKDSKGNPFYEPYEAQELAKQYESELGMRIMTFNEILYLPMQDRYVESHEVPKGEETASISGTQVREEYLAKGRALPGWFTRPGVASILKLSYPPSSEQGFCLWFTGLSGAGKSTIAQAVEAALHERGRRTTMFDGDIVRENLSKGLGFSKEDRETNIARVGFVASQVIYHHGIAICALISPYEEARRRARSLFDEGKFIEIYLSTPIEVCEERDPKGHYAKTRQGKMKGFTGVDDEYQPPLNPDITIDTSQVNVRGSIKIIFKELSLRGFIDEGLV